MLVNVLFEQGELKTEQFGKPCKYDTHQNDNEHQVEKGITKKQQIVQESVDTKVYIFLKIVAILQLLRQTGLN